MGHDNNFRALYLRSQREPPNVYFSEPWNAGQMISFDKHCGEFPVQRDNRSWGGLAETQSRTHTYTHAHKHPHSAKGWKNKQRSGITYRVLRWLWRMPRYLRAFRLTTAINHKHTGLLTVSKSVICLVYTCVKLKIRHGLSQWDKFSLKKVTTVMRISNFSWVGTRIKQTIIALTIIKKIHTQ